MDLPSFIAMLYAKIFLLNPPAPSLCPAITSAFARVQGTFMRPLIPVSAVIDSRRTYLSAMADKESKPYSARWYDNESK